VATTALDHRGHLPYGAHPSPPWWPQSAASLRRAAARALPARSGHWRGANEHILVTAGQPARCSKRFSRGREVIAPLEGVTRSSRHALPREERRVSTSRTSARDLRVPSAILSTLLAAKIGDGYCTTARTPTDPPLPRLSGRGPCGWHSRCALANDEAEARRNRVPALAPLSTCGGSRSSAARRATSRQACQLVTAR